jgi:hypothetical protein
MFGIAVEIGDAIGAAREMRIETETARRNEATILSMTPGRQPIFSAAAFAELHLGTNSIRTNLQESGVWKTALLDFSSTNLALAIHLGSDESPLWWGPSDKISVSLNFGWKPGDIALGRWSTKDMPAEDFLKQLDRCALLPPFLWLNTPVEGGNITLVLNGAVAKRFRVPAQVFCFTNASGQFVPNIKIIGLGNDREIVDKNGL